MKPTDKQLRDLERLAMDIGPVPPPLTAAERMDQLIEVTAVMLAHRAECVAVGSWGGADWFWRVDAGIKKAQQEMNPEEKAKVQARIRALKAERAKEIAEGKADMEAARELGTLRGATEAI